jgi:hypothetical protein
VLKTFILLFFALLAPAFGQAAATPTGLTVTAIQTDQSATLSWDNDPTVQQFFIYLDGVLVYQPLISSTTVNGSQRQFRMTSMPYRSPIGINMKAFTSPNPPSALSATVYAYAKPVSPTDVIQKGSDNALPIYTTVPAGSLPDIPPYVDQAGPGYEFGACTTCTAGARFVAAVRYNASYLTSVTCEVTKTTGVQGISMCFLTPAARTRTTVFNPSANSKVLRVLEWWSSTPPNFPVESLQELTPGASLIIEDCLPYLNLISPGGTPSAPASVLHVTDQAWQGTYYP